MPEEKTGYSRNPDFGEVTTNELFTDPVTMFVRAGGSDSNSGLSSTDAKASIDSAIKDAPVNGATQQGVVVDIGSGTFAINLTAFNWPIGQVVFDGAGDTNDAETTTIEPSGSTGFTARNIKATFKNLHFATSQDRKFVTAGAQSFVEIESTCSVDHGSQPAFTSKDTASLSVACDIPHDTDARSGSIINASGGLSLSGTITQSGASNVQSINIFDGSGRIDINAPIIGLGSGTTTSLIRAQSPRHIKLSDVAFEGANRIIETIAGAEVIAQAGLNNLVDITNELGNIQGWVSVSGNGSIPEFFGLPRSTDNPTNYADATRSQGTVWYDTDLNAPLFKSNEAFTSYPMGTLQIPGATASDVPQNGAVFDPTNTRLLYKEKDGTVHYWNTDGTL
jgi:hypothetical protein